MALAATIARAIACASFAATGPGVSRSPLAAFLARRLFLAGFYSTGAAPLAGLTRHLLAPACSPLSRAVHLLAASGAARLKQVRCYSTLNSSSDSSDSGSDSSDQTPTKMEPVFPGLDFEHWLIVMDKAGREGATKQQLIDSYIQTLAKFVGSEEEAKKKIYSVCCDRYFGFGCEIDEETSKKLEGHTSVILVLPDSYVDFEFKDYGAELFVNGEIVERPPERQRRLEPASPFVRKENQQ
ncbi:hypothetical protein Taro_052790 [Colocasia esculenta]|uniref:MORF/ORRM1/DAG-like MORF domain-containing protein n=1 Tax=Colocasia esculenta TaxID=4460 RepID=A0A843XKX7_COLES|nr:hypothetical protein [Colocasia esculenta]